MSEIFLKNKYTTTNDFHGKEASNAPPDLVPNTLLVCTTQSYKHENHYLTTNQVNELFTLIRVAHEQKRELNRMITIHLKDLKEKTPQILLSELMEKTRKWLQRNGFEHAHLWILENGKIQGIHAHILVHIPNHHIHQYKRLLRKWLPAEITDKGFNIKKVRYPAWGQLSGRSCVYGALRYMCKGLSPNTPLHKIKPAYQGKIIGRRCGYSKLEITHVSNTT